MELVKRHSFYKSDLKIRAESDGEKYIEGYFAVFEQETELWPGCYEKIARGAFDNSLKNNDIRCLLNHNSDFVLGRNASSTLQLNADAHGLYGKVRVNQNDSMAMDAYARVERGDVSGCSFGFWPISEEVTDRGDSVLWTVLEADTIEVSVCTFPAYPQTEIQARKKDFEQLKHRMLENKKIELRKKLEGIKC